MDGSQVSMEMSCTESLLTTSQYAKVIFHDVPGRYSSVQDLQCHYTILAEELHSRFGDRVALFKLGWHSVTEYHVFEWAAQVPPHTKCSVVFRACNLPSDPSQFYQFCYIDAENSMCGASVPFQFCGEPCVVVDGQPARVPQPQARPQAHPHCHACSQLNKQNQFLEGLVSHVTSTLSQYEQQLGELRQEVDGVKEVLEGTQAQVADLRGRLEMAGDEFKKLYMEKKRTERKYEKLVKKCVESKKATSTCDSEEQLGELAPLPACPLLLQPL